MLMKSTLDGLEKYVKHHLNQPALQLKIIKDKNVYNVSESMEPLDLHNYVTHNRKRTFREILFHFIDQKNINDVTIYKKAWLDRRHFSKIRSNPDYQIGKNTVIALCMALELSVAEANELLHAAGFTLSNSHTNDLIVQFCLENKIYNLHDVNLALEHYSLKPLISAD